MKEIFASPFFGLAITIISFFVFSKFAKKVKSPLANPILLSVSFIMLFLHLFAIPLEDYDKGGQIINMFLSPVMAVLAFSIYREIHILKKYFLAIVIGCFTGSLVSVASAIMLSHLFGLSDVLAHTMAPKSVTTPIAVELSAHLGGLPPITVAAVIITGIMGAMFAPWAIKFFKVKDPVAAGVAIGTCSHGVGTSKAFELGELEGATSGIAIGVAGMMTVGLVMAVKFL